MPDRQAQAHPPARHGEFAQPHRPGRRLQREIRLMHGRVVKQAVLLALVTLAGSLHPRNAFKGSYDMPALVSACPALQVAFTVDLSLALLP